jgi:hypothetical protein
VDFIELHCSLTRSTRSSAIRLMAKSSFQASVRTPGGRRVRLGWAGVGCREKAGPLCVLEVGRTVGCAGEKLERRVAAVWAVGPL